MSGANPSLSALQLVQIQVNRCGWVAVIVFGIFGNACIVIVFGRRLQNSCAVCLVCAAVFNSLSILVNLPTNLYGLDHVDPSSVSLVFCRIRLYCSHVWTQIARYLIILACIDRYILTTNNVRFQAIGRPMVMRSIIGMICIFWHVLSIHILILTPIVNGRCASVGLYNIVYFAYSVIAVGIIPPVLMIVFGILAYHNMKGLYARIHPISGAAEGNGGNNTIPRRDQELLVMVLAETAVCVIINLPYPIISLVPAVTNFAGVSKSIQYLQVESLVVSVGFIGLFFNSVVPFYTYLAASRAFRKDVKKLFRKWGHRLVRRAAVHLNQVAAQQHP